MSGGTVRSLEYLESLPGTIYNKLYQQPSTALAIFRLMLTPLAKTLVMALLYASRPLPTPELESWVRPSARRERDAALQLLQRLHMLRSATPDAGGPAALRLTKPFAGSLRRALTGGGSGDGAQRSLDVPCEAPPGERVSLAELDAFARRQWEAVLGFLVGSAEGVALPAGRARVSEGVKALLRDGGLVRATNHRGGGGGATITTEGFAFVLQEAHSQVWTVLINYLETCHATHMDPTEVLAFLFALSGLELGRAYPRAPLSPTQRRMLEDLADVGLVYPAPAGATVFYPTRLATTLTAGGPAGGGSSGGSGSSGGDNGVGATTSQAAGHTNGADAATAMAADPDAGYVVVETNYRVYAYTTSALQIAVLQLFAKLGTRYPNLVAGKITRASVRRAVALGITSEQIIAYLAAHAHPQMRAKASAEGGGSGGSSSRGGGVIGDAGLADAGKDAAAKAAAAVLPPTVVDQIRLWQIEGERMQATPGYLFKDFASEAEFRACCTYAGEVGVLAWSDAARRTFFVSSMEPIRQFVTSQTKRT